MKQLATVIICSAAGKKKAAGKRTTSRTRLGSHSSLVVARCAGLVSRSGPDLHVCSAFTPAPAGVYEDVDGHDGADEDLQRSNELIPAVEREQQIDAGADQDDGSDQTDDLMTRHGDHVFRVRCGSHLACEGTSIVPDETTCHQHPTLLGAEQAALTHRPARTCDTGRT